MAPLMLGFAPLAVLFLASARIAAVYGTNASPSDELPHQQRGAIIPEKLQEATSILENPPAAFSLLMNAVPFSLYGKDKNGNYIAFCNSRTIDWDAISGIGPEELSDYIKYVALFFWHHVDQRPDSSLTLVVDARGFSFNKIMNGSVPTVLNSIVTALNDTVPFVGERPGHVFLINAPSFLGPVMNVAKKLVRSKIDFLAFKNRKDWEIALRDHIGSEHLPVEYGGTNEMKLEDSPVVKYIKRSVTRLIKLKRTVPRSKM